MRRYLITFAISILGVRCVPAQSQISLTVDATMDLYRAGGYNDGSDGISPAVYTFKARPGSVITFSSVSGAWTCYPGVPEFGPDGTSSGCFQAGGQNISDPGGPFSSYHLTDFEGALAGVFLGDTLPASQPPGLRFYKVNSSLRGIRANFPSLSPEIGQIFFIGDGLTGTGTGKIQVFRVPPTATHLYLGYVDSCGGGPTPGCYSDNLGSMTANLLLQHYVPDWVQSTISSAPSARASASLAYDPAAHSTLLFGGSNARLPGVVYNDTWSWSQNRWTQLSPANSPSGRTGAQIAFDAATGTIVLFGGQDANGIVFGDTWTWDGVNWTQQFPPVSPPARNGYVSQMVYDPVTQTVLLFGGCGNSTGDYGCPPFGDTWEWNGRTKTWTQDFPAGSPSPRGTTLAYDALTKTVVLFAGDNGGGDCCRIYYDDTWTWNGIKWTQQSPATSPSARTAQAMAYDADLGNVIMFGGTAAPPQGLNDTWAWNGKNWVPLTWATQPTGLWIAPMVFDPPSGGLLLFGGELTGDVVTNNTWLFVSVPVR